MICAVSQTRRSLLRAQWHPPTPVEAADAARAPLVIERRIQVPLDIAAFIPICRAVSHDVDESLHRAYNRFKREPCGESSTV